MQQPLLLSHNNMPAQPATLLRSLLLWLVLLTATAAYAQQPFITTWKTDNTGSSNSTSITIPTTGGGYNYEVDWNNDGVYDQSGITGNVTHDFGAAGTYTIRIRGTFPRINFDYLGDYLKLVNISQWGSIAWTSMATAFRGCENLQITATDLPDLSGVTNMSQMFNYCTSLNGPTNIGNWNTASVTNMSGVFSAASTFNQPVGNWNTANVTNMASMFANAVAFNQPVSTWNTANVTSMFNLFFNADAFNQPVGNWNTANVTNMSYMFASNATFNQPLNNWNTANVTYMDYMFINALAFNQPIGNWNIANVSDMSYMFYGAGAFNQSLGNWTLRPAGVTLSSMLNNSGLDCASYSSTLIGWSNNPNTPTGRTLGATGRQYGTNAVAARTNLDVTKNWTINGDAASGVACTAVLPVELITFHAKQQGNNVLLEWQTASEQNNKGFYIERSNDGLRWMEIGFVKGKGTSSENQFYTFLDEEPLSERNYYRLRQTDFDGKAEVSNVVSVEIQNAGTVRVFPNPVSNGELNLFLNENMEEVTVKLFSSTGQLLHSQKINDGNNSLNVTDLPDGIYTLQVGNSFEKIVVQN